MGIGGWFDKLGHTAKAFGGAVKAPAGLVVDLATAPWNDDDEYNGFINTVVSRTATRLGDVAAPFTDDQSLIGGFDEAVGATLKGAEWLRDEGVSQPLSTLYQVEARAFTGESNPISGKTWREAYRDAEHISPGQAIALSTADLKDRVDPKVDADLDRAFGDPEGYKQSLSPAERTAFSVSSGLFDATLSWYADPTVVGGKVAKVARIKGAVRPVTAKTDFNKLMAEKSPVDRFLNDVSSDTPGGAKTYEEIMRYKAIKESPQGPAIASLLAGGTRERNALVLRVAHGDMGAAAELRAKYTETADIANRMMREDIPALKAAMADPYGQRAFYTQQLSEAEQELGAQHGLADFYHRVVGETVTNADGTTTQSGGVISSMTARSASPERLRTQMRVWSKSPYARPLVALVPEKPVQSLTTPRPKGWLNFNDPNAATDLGDMLSRVKGMDPATRGALMADYAKQTTEVGKLAAKHRAEEAAFSHTAAEYGLDDPKTAKLLFEKMRTERGSKLTQARTRRYSAAKVEAPDGEGMRYADLIDEDSGAAVALPIDTSQLANAEPLMDVDAVRKVLRRNRRLTHTMVGQWKATDWVARGGFKVVDAVEHGLGVFSGLWKTSVLFRFGFPIRMGVDDQSRVMASAGALSQFSNAARGTGNVWRNMHRTRVLPADEADALIGAGKARLVNEGADEGTKVVELSKARIGKGKEVVNGQEIQAMFGPEGFEDNTYRALASSNADHALQHLLGGERGARLQADRAHWGNAKTVTPDEANHLQAWTDSIGQIRKGEFGKKWLENPDWTAEDAARWLRGTDEGRALHKRMGWQDQDDWSRTLEAHLDQYLPGELREIAATRMPHADELEKFRTRGVAPDVHGPSLEEALGVGRIGQGYEKIRNGWYKFAAEMPSDMFSRHPLAATVYRQKMQDLIGSAQWQAKLKGRTHLEKWEVAALERAGRQEAIKTLRGTLFDVSSYSNAAHFFRHISPFFGAWQEGITKWAGIAAKDPSVAAHARQIWNAPFRAGIVVDEHGQVVDEDGGITDSNYLVFQVPDFAESVFGAGSWRMPLNGMFLAIQGDPWWLPGGGPVVQIPANEIVRENPDLEESLKILNPMGVQDDWKDILKPATLKRFESWRKGEGDAQFVRSMNSIYIDMTVDYRKGERATPPTWEEAKSKTKRLYALRTVANFVMPFSPIPDSPYKFHIDQYRKLLEKDPATADEKFYKRFGETYFPLTYSLSENNTGLPATKGAVRGAKRFKDLIAENPDDAALIVGPEADGEFSQAAYTYESTHRVGPGHKQTFRSSKDPREAFKSGRISEGWMRYQKAMNVLEVAAQDRQPGSRPESYDDLAEYKGQIIDQMARQNPEWFETYASFDSPEVFDARINRYRKYVADPRLAKDPFRTDIRTLGRYIGARDTIQGELARRAKTGGASTLGAQANADLAHMWGQVVGQLVESDTRFGDLYYRFLERDPMVVAAEESASAVPSQSGPFGQSSPFGDSSPFGSNPFGG